MVLVQVLLCHLSHPLWARVGLVKDTAFTGTVAIENRRVYQLHMHFYILISFIGNSSDASG